VAQVGRLAHPLYAQDLEAVAGCGADLSALEGATVGVAGATGMVGTVLVDALMAMAREGILDVRVVALGRSEAKARGRLPWFGDPRFSFEGLDVSVPGACPQASADVVVHLASATHPRAYATRPIGTITSNVVGLQNLLGWADASAGSSARFLFASSVEVYGRSRGDVERFPEGYTGDIDCCTLRAGYPEAKRLGEALCQAWATERGTQVFVPRLPRLFGPTLLPSDTKALSQFLHRAVAGEDVVLKSEGTQQFSYLYAADAVCGLLWVLTRGDAGKAYNVSDPSCDVRLRDLASMVARAGGSQVVFDLPDEVERAGFSTADKALMDGSRLKGLGWRPRFTLEDGVERTVRMLRDLSTLA